MTEKNLLKIRQNLDVKQRTIAGVRQLKEYLYNKRANLTYEEINIMMNTVIHDALTLGYESGWEDRNEIYKARKSKINSRLIKAFNEFYNENVSNIPIYVMEKIHYLVDIALLNRYFNESLPFEHQVHDFKHF